MDGRTDVRMEGMGRGRTGASGGKYFAASLSHYPQLVGARGVTYGLDFSIMRSLAPRRSLPAVTAL